MFLSKVFTKVATKGAFTQLPKYTFSTQALTFNSLENVQSYLDTKQPIFYCAFFASSWNPQCEEAEKKFNELVASRPDFEFIKVDCDTDIRTKRYYGVKYEPEFVVCCMGTEIFRHVGLGLDKLDGKFDKVVKMYQSTEFLGATRKYESYHKRFMEEWGIFDKDFDYYSR